MLPPPKASLYRAVAVYFAKVAQVTNTLEPNSFDGVLFDHFPVAMADFYEFKFSFIAAAYAYLRYSCKSYLCVFSFVTFDFFLA